MKDGIAWLSGVPVSVRVIWFVDSHVLWNGQKEVRVVETNRRLLISSRCSWDLFDSPTNLSYVGSNQPLSSATVPNPKKPQIMQSCSSGPCLVRLR